MEIQQRSKYFDLHTFEKIIKMNIENFIKKIHHIGIIDKQLHYEARRNLIGVLCTESFLMTLQEIDSSVYKHYVPMEIDYSEIFNNKILLFNYKDLMDLNEQKSVFLSSNPRDLIFAKEYTQKKLDNFFIKPRFKNNSFDLDLKLIMKRFINEFVAFKMFYLLMSNLI